MENKTESKTAEQTQSEHERCDKVISTALKQNPYLNHLITAMDKLGCEVTSQFFKCKPCSKPASGFFDTKLGIVMCENHPMTQKKSEDTIVHEMIHAYDHCKNVFDKNNCVHIACSEIRAQNLSGECQWTKEVARQNFNFKKQHKECVRRRAELSLSMIPACSANAKISVEKAWASCVKDLEPFHHVP
jgi:inner membrane protease ATP23